MVAILLVWLLAYHVDATRVADGDLYGALRARGKPVPEVLGNLLAFWMSPLPYAAIVAGVCLHALSRRGMPGALAAAAILVGSNVVTQALKHLTAAPRPWSRTASGYVVDPISWPSGHTTAAVALTVCVVLAAPPGRRLLVGAIGAVYAFGVGAAVVVLGWHMLSDVVGAVAVVAAVAGVTVALLRSFEARRPAVRGPREDLGVRVAAREPV